ncbi:hypothetical protein DIPPA_19730 [Diplonema papillatum]|nr:hypothetical protein DIPPA_19730 [Diplonema papillatum]
MPSSRLAAVVAVSVLVLGPCTASEVTIQNYVWSLTFEINSTESTPDVQGATFLRNAAYLQSTFNVATGNLARNIASVGNYSAARLSASSISINGPSRPNWFAATGGRIVSQRPGNLIIGNITLGTIATETWNITLDGPDFNWVVTRKYLTDVASMNTTRYATLSSIAEASVSQYQATNPQSSSQIPSTIDTTFQWDQSNGLGFIALMGNNVPDHDNGLWVYTYTPLPDTALLMSPSDTALHSTVSSHNVQGANAVFGFQWPETPGVGGGDTSMAMGAISHSPNPATKTAGTIEMVGWQLRVGSSEGVAAKSRVVLSTGNTRNDELTANLSRTFNMWAGNTFGNSPASIVCLHEMSFFSQIASVFFPPGIEATSPYAVNGSTAPVLHQALRQELLLFAEHAVNASGYVYPRWTYFAYVYIPLNDQIPHFLMCYYHYAVLTGDKAFIKQVWPQLMKVMDYMLNTMGMVNGLATSAPTATGLPNSSVADNWFDIIGFGGNDAIINALGITALNAYTEMADWVGETERSAQFKAQHNKSTTAYYAAFYNETLGLFGDWMDTNNNTRYYYYIWQQALVMDPLSGMLTTQEKKDRMIRGLDTLYSDIYATNEQANETLWCVPTNLVSVAPEDTFFNGTLQDQKVWGHYENGCCFMVFQGLEIALRGFGGDADAGVKMFEKVLDHFEAERLWGQHYDWAAGTPEYWDGTDVLTDTLMTVYGATRAMFGFQPTLSDVKIVSAPPKSLAEGSIHNFYHLGQPTQLKLVNGSVVVTKL